jgi:transposase
MNYIGMDAHSRESFFVVMGKSGRTLREGKVRTNESDILGFVRGVKGKKALAFEEGIVSQWLYVLLKEEVDELVVCQPSEHKGAKTDKIDAHEIADLLRVGRLKAVFHEDNELMNLRALISGYGDVVQELTRAKNRYKALYRQTAIDASGAAFYKEIERISELRTEAQRYVACTLFEQIGFLEEQKRGYQERFESNASKHRPIKLLTSIPGIGEVRANQIVGIVVTPYRFAKKYNFFSYAMLTKHEQESGGKKYRKKRAHGQAVLKDVFKSAVLGAMKSNTAFRRKYDEMRAAGANDRAARNAVAKKIAATVLGVWKSGKKYNDKYLEVTRRRKRNSQSGT